MIKVIAWFLFVLVVGALGSTGVIGFGFCVVAVIIGAWRGWVAADKVEKDPEYQKKRENADKVWEDWKAERERLREGKRPVSTELISIKPVSKFGVFGRGLVGGMLFGGLGAMIGAFTTDMGDEATFMVTQADGTKRKMTVRVEDKEFNELWGLLEK